MASVRKIQTKDGPRWRVRVYSHTVDNGDGTQTRKYITRTYDRKTDADAEGARLEHLKDVGTVVVSSKEPLGSYLRTWLNNVMRGRIRSRTWSDYDGVLRRYVEEPPSGIPRIGEIRLNRLGSDAIQGVYAALQAQEGLAPRTIRSLHAVVRQGLAHAARKGALGQNPADLVVLPKLNKRDPDAMTGQEAARFLVAAKADRYAALWAVLISGALRPGEALGLKWSDVDLDTGRIRVQRSLVRRGVRQPKPIDLAGDPEDVPEEPAWKLEAPKTAKARRTVALGDMAVRALKEHKAKQAKEKLALGEEYETHGFVFATEFGRPLDASNLYDRNFRRVMAGAKLGTWEVRDRGTWRPETPSDAEEKRARRFRPAYRMYDLRHTAATLLLQSGVNPKVTSERLGHSSVAFTMDVYSASLPDMQEEAAAKLDRALSGA